MTKEKWAEIVSEEVQKCYGTIKMENWQEYRFKFLDFVKNVDEATEVYNMENTKKENV